MVLFTVMIDVYTSLNVLYFRDVLHGCYCSVTVLFHVLILLSSFCGAVTLSSFYYYSCVYCLYFMKFITENTSRLNYHTVIYCDKLLTYFLQEACHFLYLVCLIVIIAALLRFPATPTQRGLTRVFPAG